MANPIAVLKVPHDVSLPSAGITEADWIQNKDIWERSAENIQRLNSRAYDIRNYGGLNGGVTLASKYATLAAAQVDYPHATRLDQTLDWAALQKIANELQGTTSYGGAEVILPTGMYYISDPIVFSTPGTVLRSSGGIGAIIYPTANFTAGQWVFTFETPGGWQRGLNIKGIRVDMTQAPNGVNVFDIVLPYDTVLLQDVYINKLKGNATAWRMRVPADPAVPVAAGVLAENLYVACDSTQEYSGKIFDLDRLQEATFINCKAIGSYQNYSVGTSYALDGCRGVVFLGCSAAWANKGWHLTANVQASWGITIDTPTVESVFNTVWAEGTAANPAGSMMRVQVRNIRPQASGMPPGETLDAGPVVLKTARYCQIDADAVVVTMDAATSDNTVWTRNHTKILNTGTNNTIIGHKSSINNGVSFNPGIVARADSNPRMEFRAGSSNQSHYFIWASNGSAGGDFSHRYSNGTFETLLHRVDQAGISQHWSVSNGTAPVETLRIERLPTTGKTAVYIATNRAGTVTLQQVEVGEVDSGGTGYRVLRIPN